MSRSRLALGGLTLSMGLSVLLPLAGEGFRIQPVELIKLVASVVGVAAVSAGLSRFALGRHRPFWRHVLVATALSEAICVLAVLLVAYTLAKRPAEVLMWAPIIVPFSAAVLFPTVFCAAIVGAPVTSPTRA